MFENTKAFSGFSVSDLAAAKKFYGETLGLPFDEERFGIVLHLATGADVFVYPKEDHAPATFTILNFPVGDIDAAVDALTEKGVTFKQYGSADMPQDEKGIMRGLAADQGPDIAWFSDPAGNVLSVMQTS